jgi:hypothetical protein
VCVYVCVCGKVRNRRATSDCAWGRLWRAAVLFIFGVTRASLGNCGMNFATLAVGYGCPACDTDAFSSLLAPVYMCVCVCVCWWVQGPYGTGQSTPSYGQCPIDRKWHNENYFMKQLGHAKLHAFEAVHGWAMWSFK